MREIDWHSIESMTPESEQMKLEEWARNHYNKRNLSLRILEIGTYHGQSAACLAKFGYVWAVDLWGNVDDGLGHYEGIGQHHFTSFIQNMIRLKLIDIVFPVCTTSNSLHVFQDRFIDIIHIDASHKYEEVAKDIGNSLRLLCDDGLMIFDDYKRPGFGPDWGTNDPWEGVARAVDELLYEGNMEIYEHFEGKVCLKRRHNEE